MGRVLFWSAAVLCLAAAILPAGATARTAEAGYETYVACEMNHKAPEASSCQLGEHVSAFIQASHETEYVICVLFPSGKTKCSEPETIPAGALYANRIYSNEVGTEQISWQVDDKIVGEASVRIERPQVRLATQVTETPLQVRPPLIGYTGDGTGFLAGRKDNPRHITEGLAGGGLHWLSWGPRSAVARGWDWVDDCRPDCARGSFRHFRAIVRARRPRHGLFTRMTVKAKVRGRWSYDHRKLDYFPPETIGGEQVPAYWEWGICGPRLAPRC
jgi:hypothetical protein